MRDTYIGRSSALASTLLLVTLGLWGCAGTPPKEDSGPQEPTPVELQPAQEKELTLALPHSEFSATFGRAEQALARFNWMEASVALEELSEQALSPDERAYERYLQARIDYTRGQQSAAMTTIDSLSAATLTPALHYRVLSFRSHMLQMQGDFLDGARSADQILQLGRHPSAPDWKRTIWHNLQRATPEQLQAAINQTHDPRWLGWLELARIGQESALVQQTELPQWRKNNPGHPAANPLPGGLDYLLNNPGQGGKAALMLPLSGRLAPAGKAVLDGYLASYYDARATGGANHELLVLDLGQFPSASMAYDEAVRQGAELVVGPLSKSAVADMATLLERPVPVLTLNRIDEVMPATGSALVQLSLAPEDEAEQLTELAYGSGARSALIVSPRGEWGDKVSAAAQRRWKKLGGAIVSSAAYGDQEDYSEAVKTALGLSASEQRASTVRDMLATNIEFTPRRRQDPDVIFLLSRNGAEARSIKPLLAFHYAGTLPVYAMSGIYNGVPDERNRDLNGIALVETPWLLGANPALRTAITAGDTGGDAYPRLNALGADAFILQSGFARLQAGPDALLRGNTGLLTMDPQLHIRRELTPATFDEGVVRTQ